MRYAELSRHSVDGYELWTDPDVPHRSGRSIAHHRLIAFAHGELDAIAEPLEVDHLRSIEWLNYADNLEAVDVIEHGRRTRRRATDRRSRS